MSTSALSLLTPPPRDPAQVLYSPVLPMEIALRQRSVQKVCEAYDIDAAEWQRLKTDSTFVEDLKHWIKKLREEGMTFKALAQLQSEELLKTSWQMIHYDEKVPHAVRADLLKFTIRAAGLDGSKDQAANATASNQLQINLVLA